MSGIDLGTLAMRRLARERFCQMEMSSECVYCVVSQMDRYYMRFVGDENNRMSFLRKVCAAIGESKEETHAPVINGALLKLVAQEAGKYDLFEEEKHVYNQSILKMEDSIKAHIDAADDKLYRALQYAMLGNYIDFGTSAGVSMEKLNELIETAPDIDLGETYERFRQDIEKARTLAYLFDNCGEVVFDKMCIATIKELYPSLHIIGVVRGMPAYNDVTMEDALEVGLDKLVPIVGNGDDLPGTILSRIAPEVRELIESADIVISKGMGNYETLDKSGLNIYYLLLCKCDRFMKEFGKPRLASVFASEKAEKTLE